MITSLLIAVVLLFLFTILFIGARGFAEKLNGLDELSSRLKPVNVEALRNLLDPAQDVYLVQRLSKRDLRSVRRERAIVAIEYVWRIAGNAALLMRAADLANRSSSPEIATAGARIANSALRTRLLALRTLFSLTLAVILPGQPLGSTVLQQYTSLDTDVHLLTLAASPRVGESRSV